MNDYQLQEQHEHQQWLVYDKLQRARVKLQSIELKKSGHNKFAGYRYFELADFLPTVNNIFYDLKLSSTLEFTNEIATMRIIDTENGGFAKFTCPMAEAHLKGCHPVQNLGASITYITRYLLVMAMAIVEHDAIDSSEPVDEKKSAKPITVDVFDKMDAKTQELIEDIAMDVRMLLQKNDLQGAIDYITLQELDADSKTAFWSRLDSKERSAIKKFSTGK
jgi:hypothetical protein